MTGVIGSVFTIPSIATWYEQIQKPDIRPPNWVFGPVWITLYALMGISLYWIIDKKIRTPVILFSIQLVLNAIWSIIFFGLQNPFYALIEIMILWVMILLTVISFYKVSRKAGLILLPYIIWVTIAMILNYYIWILN
jgi:tryptophan-rich sensory protein